MNRVSARVGQTNSATSQYIADISAAQSQLQKTLSNKAYNSNFQNNFSKALPFISDDFLSSPDSNSDSLASDGVLFQGSLPTPTGASIHQSVALPSLFPGLCQGKSTKIGYFTAKLTVRVDPSPGRYVLKIHFFIELGLKMIQFKTKSRIFIQKNIHSIESRTFNKIIHS